MASTFYALELPSGESFLLQTEHMGRGFTVLVDGGGRRSGPHHPLVKAILKAASVVSHLDVVICTHQDADHANGLRDFADAWCSEGRTIGEFWLPGSWAAAFPDVLTQPAHLVEQVVAGAVQVIDGVLRGDAEEGQVLRRLAEDMAREDFGADLRYNAASVLREFSERKTARNPEGDVRHFDDPECYSFTDPSSDDRFERTVRSLGLTEEIAELVSYDRGQDGPCFGPFFKEWKKAYKRPRDWQRYLRKERSKSALVEALLGELVARALDTAESVRLIAAGALSQRIPIRWFDFGLFEESGETRGGFDGLLVPINAVELTKPPPSPSPLALLYSLVLTQQNVESLVFERVQTTAEPAVFFLGDSRLAFGVTAPGKAFKQPSQIPSRAFLATAPHHGSYVNDYAYKVLGRWVTQPLLEKSWFVRNGGMHRQHAETFKTLENRRCAQCYRCHGRDWRQLVAFQSWGAGMWIPVVGKICIP